MLFVRDKRTVRIALLGRVLHYVILNKAVPISRYANEYKLKSMLSGAKWCRKRPNLIMYS